MASLTAERHSYSSQLDALSAAVLNLASVLPSLSGLDASSSDEGKALEQVLRVSRGIVVLVVRHAMPA